MFIYVPNIKFSNNVYMHYQEFILYLGIASNKQEWHKFWWTKWLQSSSFRKDTNRRRRNTKYIVNRKIDTKTRRGKACTDKIFRGGEMIINDCETLHNATGATIKAFIWRTNDLRATKVYESPNFKGYTPFDFEENDKQPIFTPYRPHIQDKSRRRVPSTDKEFRFISSEKIEERPMPNL